MESKFPLGELVMTSGVVDLMKTDEDFAQFVGTSLARYTKCDWGDLCVEDYEHNNEALVSEKERILASYEDTKHSDWKIWIVTEWDHSATTFMFPDEY